MIFFKGKRNTMKDKRNIMNIVDGPTTTLPNSSAPDVFSLLKNELLLCAGLLCLNLSKVNEKCKP